MTTLASGLLPALVGYYRRLEGDPDQSVADFGFSAEKLHFAIVLEPDGSLHSFKDLRDRSRKGKPQPTSLVVPDGGGRSGTGLKPFFCWDNTGYALGRDNKGNADRAAQMFAAFRDLHRSFLPELAEDDGFAALCRFLDRWGPSRAESLPNWDEAAGLNVVFQLRGREGYVHQGPAVRDAWSRRLAPLDGEEAGRRGISLLSGEEEEIARLHPQIGGVLGANTTGAAIVSFNLDAFESYGKSQGYNAPIGVGDAFRYTTALNRLLANPSRRVQIGDATVVFWSESPQGGEAEDLLGQIFGGDFARGEEAERARMVHRIRGFLDDARKGRLSDRIEDPDAPFYILGLSPNASRLQVRYWLAGTVRQFAERLALHVEQLAIVGDRDDAPPPTIRRLLLETAREPKDISPRLAGAATRSVLEGLPYPRTLFDAVLRRIRIEANITRVKAAILKAYLVRNGGFDMDTAVNRVHPEPAYHCGRMLALLALAQEEAIKSINVGVVRRNMAAAMASPGLVLGRLQRNAELGHLHKLDGDFEQFVRDELRNINVRIGDRLPRVLDSVRQGIFALGFYQEQEFLQEAKAAVKNRRRHRSERGEWMASKLEVRVASILARKQIAYLYEPRAVLKSGHERWPDFLIEGGRPSEHIYLEVLGFPGPEYQARWESKKAAYLEIGITEGGGEKGRLVVLDWRDRWVSSPDDEIEDPTDPPEGPIEGKGRGKAKAKYAYPSDADVLDLLRPILPTLAASK